MISKGLRQVLKHCWYGTAYRLRLHRLKPVSRQTRGVVFFVHRVLGDTKDEPAACVFRGIPAQALDIQVFTRRLQHLQRQWQFVSLDEFAKHVKTEGQGRIAALTFDDCYADFATQAQPILEGLRIPATFFITVDPLQQQRLLWFDQVYSSTAGATRPSIELSGLTLKLGSDQARIRAAAALCALLVELPGNDRCLMVRKIVDAIGPGPVNPAQLYLSSDQLQQLARRPGASIGSHTLTHPNLCLLDDRALAEELAESKESLERICGKEVSHLSYPNGQWNQRVIQAVRSCGYQSAYGTATGEAGNCWAWPRMNLGWWSDAEFFVKVAFRHG